MRRSPAFSLFIIEENEINLEISSPFDLFLLEMNRLFFSEVTKFIDEHDEFTTCLRFILAFLFYASSFLMTLVEIISQRWTSSFSFLFITRKSFRSTMFPFFLVLIFLDKIPFQINSEHIAAIYF